MLNKIKSSSRLVFIYSIGSISAKLTGFILLPLYAGHLSIKEYGAIVLIEPIWQLLAAILAVSLPSALLRWLSPEKDLTRQKTLVFTALVAILGILLLFNLIAFPLNSLISSSGLYADPNFGIYLNLSFPLVSFDILNLLVLSLLRFHERPWFYITLNTIKLSVNLALNVYFIVGLEMGVESIILSQLIASVLLTALSVPFLLKNLVPKFDVAALKEMLAYGFPLIFTTISAIVLSLGDRFIIDHYLTRGETGLYGVGYKIGGIINMFIIQSFQLGFLPIAYKMLTDPDARRFFARVLTYFTFVLMFSAMTLSLFARELIIFFTAGNTEYQGAYAVVPLITFSFVLKGIQYYFSLGLHYVKRTSYNAWIVMGCALFSLLLNFLLIPLLGIIGAAITLVVTTLLMALFYYYYSQKFYYIQFEFRRLFIILLSGLAVFFLGWHTGIFGFWISIAIKSLLVVVFPWLLLRLNFFNADEVNRLRQAKAVLSSYLLKK